MTTNLLLYFLLLYALGIATGAVGTLLAVHRPRRRRDNVIVFPRTRDSRLV